MASLEALVIGQHHRVSVVAVGTDGAETAPLVTEVAAAPKLDVPDGDISTDFCGANTFLVRGDAIPCERLSVVTGHVRTRNGVGVETIHENCGKTIAPAKLDFSLGAPASARAPSDPLNTVS